jgi:hypothetical protein
MLATSNTAYSIPGNITLAPTTRTVELIDAQGADRVDSTPYQTSSCLRPVYQKCACTHVSVGSQSTRLQDYSRSTNRRLSPFSPLVPPLNRFRPARRYSFVIALFHELAEGSKTTWQPDNPCLGHRRNAIPREAVPFQCSTVLGLSLNG